MKKQHDQENDTALGKLIKDRVATIDKLTDLDNTKRMLARGHMALENVTRSNMVKQKNQIMESKAKDETILTLQENDKANAHRTMIKQKIAEQNRQKQLDIIKTQIAEKQQAKDALARKERAEHLRDLELQQRMYDRRQQNLDDHLQTIKDRDDKINNHFVVSNYL